MNALVSAVAALALVSLASLANPDGSIAQTCPNGTGTAWCTRPSGEPCDCYCGQTLTVKGTYTLKQNFSCPANGFTIAAKEIVLKGTNSNIKLLGTQSCPGLGVKGVTVDGSTTASKVQNLVIEGFYWGIDVANSTATTISGVKVQNNADEGIHIGGGAVTTTISSSTVSNTGYACLPGGHEDIYLFDGSSGTKISSVTVNSGPNGAASLYVKANGNSVANSTFNGKPVRITSTATGNCFGVKSGSSCNSSTNTINGAKLVLEDSAASNFAHGIKVNNPGVGEPCIEIDPSAASNTLKTNPSNLVGCSSHNVGQVLSTTASTNTFDRVNTGNPCPQVCPAIGSNVTVVPACTPTCP
jgi:parallel beta-helix repeat protein